MFPWIPAFQPQNKMAKMLPPEGKMGGTDTTTIWELVTVFPPPLSPLNAIYMEMLFLGEEKGIYFIVISIGVLGILCVCVCSCLQMEAGLSAEDDSHLLKES